VQQTLPVAFEGDAFVMDGRRFEGADVGLCLVYPNPLNQKRYVAVMAGARYGLGLPVNHPFSQIPDYLIFRAKPVTAPEEGLSRVFGRPDQHLCAGFFDSDWLVDPAQRWRRE